MSEATTQVTVHFTGAGAGDEELSWGQQEIYRAMVRQGTWLPIGGISTPSPGATVDDIADELRYLMSRYESMRTRLRFTADGRPRQVVHADGEITLEVVDTDDDPALVAAAVQRRYEHTDLDLEKQWPVRMAVIRRRGILTHQVSVFSHLVTDQAGGAVMLAEVRARNSAPVAGPGPLAQARWQQGAAGQRRSRAALRHYESLLRALTPLPADASTDRRTPRYQQAEFVSPATLLAVRAIAARLPADPATVLLTLVAIALTDTTGATAPLPLRPIVSNRFQPGLATAVANINQAGLCLLDVAGVDFEVAVERTRRASLAAFKHAYHDPAAVAELIDRVSGERGTDVDVRCFYNDRRTRPLTGPAPTLDDITTALHRTTCAWSAEPEPSADSLMWFVTDTDDGLGFSVRVDTHFLSPADTESCLYAVEALAVRAAFDRSPAPAHCRARLARTAERIAVPFAGSGAGDEPLAWGQSEVWQSMQRQRDWMPLGGRNPLPPGTSADDIAELLRYLMSRHPSMRTRLRTDDGVLRQVVAATGTARLEVVDAGDADPDEVAAAVEHRYRSNTMDHRHDWPVRMAVIRRHGELTHQVTIVSHLAIDAAAGALMLADLAARPTGAVAGMSTLEQARWQRSPAGVRQQQRSMRYWSAALHRLPTPEPVDVAEPDEPRHWLGRMSSRALPLAVQAVAERTGADSGHVLLALTAMALGACTGRDPVALRPLVNNRFRRDLAQTVAPVTQHGILVLDVAGLPFDDVLDRVSRSTMAVYKHAYFDPAGLQQLVDEVTAERGPVLRTACFVNDRRSRTAAGAQAPTAGQIRAALAATQLHLTDARDVPFNPLFLVFDDEPDALAVEFQVDTHCMPVSQLVALVRDLERLAVDVACAEVGS